MRYLLSEAYSLRGWKHHPYMLQTGGPVPLIPLSVAQMLFLQNCDGRTEQEETTLAESFLARGIIRKANPGEALQPDQAYRFFDNIYCRGFNLAITSRCDLNCLHCFMAKDENPAPEQLSLAQCEAIFDQMRACGLRDVEITGGEPLVHPDFFAILDAMRQRGLNLSLLVTNGTRLTPAALGRVLSLGFRPEVNISFDGLGCHDWLRGVPGTEEKALAAIRLCAQAELPLMINFCLHRGNLESLEPTVWRLAELGVKRIRLIRVCESPRWQRLAGEAALSPQEFLDAMVVFFSRVARIKHDMKYRVWHSFTYDANAQRGCFGSVCARGKNDGLDLPVCSYARMVPHLSSDGCLYPCHEVSGVFRALGMATPSVFDTPLSELFADESVLKYACTTPSDVAKNNPDCAACPSLKQCRTGCRTLSFGTHGGELYACDDYACVFWKGGYAEKLQRIFEKSAEPPSRS